MKNKEYRDKQDKQPITVNWWNGGHKTLDYNGDIKGFLEKKNITVTEGEKEGSYHYHFHIPLAFSEAALDTSSDYNHAVTEAILIFMTLLGDKSTLTTADRVYHVNWG